MAQIKWESWPIRGPRHYYRESLIMKVVTQMIQEGRVLDVGCGTSSLLIQFARKGYQVYGVDMSEECIRLTQEDLGFVVPESRVDIRKGNAEKIDYPDEHFDIVIAAEVLEHVENDSFAVREIYRVLRPGGVCVITVPANPALWDISDEMTGHKRGYSKQDIISLFDAASFQVE